MRGWWERLRGFTLVGAVAMVLFMVAVVAREVGYGVLAGSVRAAGSVDELTGFVVAYRVVSWVLLAVMVVGLLVAGASLWSAAGAADRRRLMWWVIAVVCGAAHLAFVWSQAAGPDPGVTQTLVNAASRPSAELVTATVDQARISPYPLPGLVGVVLALWLTFLHFRVIQRVRPSG